MRGFVFILFFVIVQIGFGQTQFLNYSEVDSIAIKSKIGAHQFDDKGTTKSKSEYLVLEHKKQNGIYILNSHFKEVKTTTFKPRSSKKEKSTIKKHLGNEYSDTVVNALLKSLLVSSNTLLFSKQLDQSEFNARVNEKTIRSLAKRMKVDWHFSMRYSTREKNETFFKNCQSKDTFEVYLSTRFDTTGYSMITDYSNTMNIIVYSDTSKFIFEGKHPNQIYQPWYFHNGKFKIDATPILNLNINQILAELLPSKFLNKNNITSEALFDDYISWYFTRHGIE